IATGIAEWFQQPENQALIEKLRRAGVRMKDDAPALPSDRPQPLAGQIVVITGTLGQLSRDAAIRAAEEAGARVTGSVSKKTSFVVVGENPGTKYEKAQSLGVQTIDEAEFLRRLGS